MRFIKPQTSGFNHCRAARRGCRAPLWLRAAPKRGAASSKRGPARPTPTDVAIAPIPWIEWGRFWGKMGEDLGEQNMGKPVINHGMWGWSWVEFKEITRKAWYFYPHVVKLAVWRVNRRHMDGWWSIQALSWFWSIFFFFTKSNWIESDQLATIDVNVLLRSVKTWSIYKVI